MIDKASLEYTYSIILKQLNLYWPTEVDNRFKNDVQMAIQRTKRSYDDSTRLYYLSDGFSILNTSVYSVFLYYLAHIVGRRGDKELADKIYYLNKIMNSVEWYWNIELPEHFIVEHPIGSVLGKAEYGDYFSIYQGVTVGERLKGDIVSWPKLGNHVIMFANSSVIGDCNIGNWVIISAESFIKNEDIPNCSVVYGKSPELVIKQYEKEEIKKYFIKSWRIGKG